MTADTFFFTIAPFFIVLSIMILALFLVVFHFFKHLDKSGGFSILAEQWPARLEPSGTVFSHQTLGLGKIWYKNCVKVVSSDGGLYILVGFPFRRGTLFYSDSGKSTLIPWGSLRFRQKRVHSGQICMSMTFKVKNRLFLPFQNRSLIHFRNM